MSSQSTRAQATPFLRQNPDLLPLTRARRPLPPRGFWLLIGLAVALNAAILLLGVSLLRSAGQTLEPPAKRRISVPYADDAALWQQWHGWVVQEDGRTKPFDTFAREALRTITGRERFEGVDPVAVVASWLLLYDADDGQARRNALQMQCDWESYPFILCEYGELREKVYRDRYGDDAELNAQHLHGKYIEPAILRDSKVLKAILQGSAARQAEDGKAVLTQLEKKASEVKKRLALYDRIRAGGQDGRERVQAPGAFGVVALDPCGSTWFSLRSVREYVQQPEFWDEMMQGRRIANDRAYEGVAFQKLPAPEIKAVNDAVRGVQLAYLSRDAAVFGAAVEKFHSTVAGVNAQFARKNADTTALELWYNSANPFCKAWVVSVLTALLLVVSLGAHGRWPLVSRVFYLGGLLSYAAALAWSAAGFYCRVSISGRPPVSNMYESVIWVGFMTAVFGLILELIYRRGVIALAGVLVSTFGLVLADKLPLTLAPNIQPLVAVLRSNYWLTIHVLTIVSSYAAFALAWGLGNFNLGVMVLAPGRRDLVKSLSQLCYRAIQIGVVLLAAGTLLGGFWAAESWGRFWGWDPKEVWALIALLCYVIPLHARYVGWVKDFGLAACAVVCFASVVMAWYGVNFVLGAGLHSYGFGGGNDAWVYWGGLINISLVVHAALRYHHADTLALCAER